VEVFNNMDFYPITMKQINTKQDLRDFTKSIQDMREDYHEASDFLNARVIGTVLDNEGFEDELNVILYDERHRVLAEVKLATLLGMAYN